MRADVYVSESYTAPQALGEAIRAAGGAGHHLREFTTHLAVSGAGRGQLSIRCLAHTPGTRAQ